MADKYIIFLTLQWSNPTIIGMAGYCGEKEGGKPRVGDHV